MIPIFVYGTLREGMHNFNRVLKGRTDKITPAVIKGYDMLNLGSYPGIISGTNEITGELMDIKSTMYLQTLQLLDKLEGYDPSQKGKSPYHREIQKIVLEDGKVIDAYVYVYNKKLGISGFEFVDSGDWVIYKKENFGVK